MNDFENDIEVRPWARRIREEEVKPRNPRLPSPEARGSEAASDAPSAETAEAVCALLGIEPPVPRKVRKRKRAAVEKSVGRIKGRGGGA